MKRNFISTVIAAVALLAIGCTREEVTPAPAPTTVVRNVNYIVCGESATATVTGEAEWHALLDSLFDAVDGGCELTFWDAAAAQQQAKETVTYTTASRDSAFTWGEKMYDEGYTVSVIFDPQTGRYNCSAVRLAPMPSDYTPIPLGEYLPGHWKIDSTKRYFLCNGTIDSTSDWILHYNGYYFRQIASFEWNTHDPYLIYDSVNDSWIPYKVFGMHEELIITSDSITRPYPLLPGRTLMQHEALGLYDSTITYHYVIGDLNCVSGPTVYLPYNENEMPSVPDFQNPCPYPLSFEVYQLSYDTMVLFGYMPVMEEGLHFGLYHYSFIRQ